MFNVQDSDFLNNLEFRPRVHQLLAQLPTWSFARNPELIYLSLGPSPLTRIRTNPDQTGNQSSLRRVNHWNWGKLRPKDGMPVIDKAKIRHLTSINFKFQVKNDIFYSHCLAYSGLLKLRNSHPKLDLKLTLPRLLLTRCPPRSLLTQVNTITLYHRLRARAPTLEPHFLPGWLEFPRLRHKHFTSDSIND